MYEYLVFLTTNKQTINSKLRVPLYFGSWPICLLSVLDSSYLINSTAKPTICLCCYIIAKN